MAENRKAGWKNHFQLLIKDYSGQNSQKTSVQKKSQRQALTNMLRHLTGDSSANIIVPSGECIFIRDGLSIV